ncbi:MAG: ATP-binding cassette domain-containing protein, partial [Rhizobiales bacterium]|nr:ATP-binding cassette domain-containing protein [Hyphomicrobiales bacterium]
EALGIIGPNGAGKSSLFNLITGTIQADAGAVRLDEVDVTHLPARQRCRMGMGRSFQIPHPFETMTVYENLAVAACYGGGRREAEAKDVCVDVLARTGLLPKANQLAGTLSLLERKRLEMARALATGPRLLLLDEIAGGLTEAECHELVGTIREVHEAGVTIIWIEHVVHALTAVVERLVALDFGKVIAEGRPDAVMGSDAVREIYLGVD